MEVLLTGNISYVTREFLDEAFPDDHVVVLRDNLATSCDSRLNFIDVKDAGLLDALGEGYDFERVVFFSDYLTPHSDREGEVDRLRQVLRRCASPAVQLVYVSGPAAMGVVDSPRDATGKAIIAHAAEELCFFYANKRGFGLKVLRCPYLYVSCDDFTSPFLDGLFSEASGGALALGGAPDSPLALLCVDDLARLLQRVFESWTAQNEVLSIPDVFGHSLGDVAEAIAGVVPELDVEHVGYGDGPGFTISPDDHVLRRRYGWFPRFDFLDDLPRLYSSWKFRCAAHESRLRKLIDALRAQRGFLPLLEVFLVWIAFELLEAAVSSSSQLSLIDYRVVYIVICATVYGLDLGVFAALLACVGLTASYFTTYGHTLQTLFYEPSNWLPFLAYLLVGAVCGYVQLRNSEGIRFQRDENSLLRDRNSFIEHLYRDALDDKRMFRRQIVGRRDSFGKIYEVTRELDDVNPREIYRKCCLIFQDILENDSVAIYHVTGEGAFARLVAACPGAVSSLPRSLPLDSLLDVLSSIDSEGIWVNRGLADEKPMYAYGVRRGEFLVVLILLRDASPEQHTLYYENLFKILCGLTETSLVRAFEYEDAVKGARTEPNSPVLLRGPFLDELSGSFALKEAKMSDHLLLRVDERGLGYAQAVKRTVSCIRDSDAMGNLGDGLYLLMAQAGDSELPIIQARLDRAGLGVQKVPYEEEYALVSSHRENRGLGLADVSSQGAPPEGNEE